ncbi:TQO small subunit DoxD [Actinoplanes sp. NPDC089786]|uniref:TQO small subunit DoxD n=1 Tax=Actinoplanes sp. NPDC089786 TaxID=3155185 RepID=UPI003415E7C3
MSRSPGRVLLPLRMFLGFTFAYAGISKLLDPAYLDPSSPAGVRQQMLAVADTSPIGFLVTLSAEHATLTGLAIALGEALVGVAVLAGLFTRAAATGGLVLALSFFLTVSWTAEPYYLGADIFVAFAWTPLTIAGDGGVLSLQEFLRRRFRSPDTDTGRRVLILGGSAATVLAATGTAIALAGRGQKAGTAIVPAVGLAIGAALKFTAPGGTPAYLLHPAEDTFLAFSAACSHQGCPVEHTGDGFRCPCHGGTYDQEGRVTGGPPPAPLARIPVQVIDGLVTTAQSG